MQRELNTSEWKTFIASFNFFAMTSCCNIQVPIWLLCQVNRCVHGPLWLIWANTAQVKKFYIPLTHGNRYKTRQDMIISFPNHFVPNENISSIGGLLICSLKHERQHVGHKRRKIYIGMRIFFSPNIGIGSKNSLVVEMCTFSWLIFCFFLIT